MREILLHDQTWGNKIEEDFSVELILICQCIGCHGDRVRVSEGGQTLL